MDRTSPAATLADVARRAGVSLATASRVLNGSTRRVQEDYRELVTTAAAELGYTPNLAAQTVAKGTASTIGLVVSDIDDPYFSALASGMISAADDHDHVVTIAVTDRSPQRELQIVRTFRGQRSRAIVLAGSRIVADRTQPALIAELEAFTANAGRVVVISQRELPFPTVQFAGRQAAAELAGELVRRGYRDFAILAGPEHLVTARERLEGFVDELARHGLIPRAVVHGEFGREGGRRAALEADLAGVDVIWAVNDVMAIGAMAGLRERGLRVPDDIAIAGFDDIATAADVTPGLTTVRLPLERAGRRAVELVFDPVDDAETVLEHALVLRDSTPVRTR